MGYKNERRLTQERLKELLHYDPDTGVFHWRKWRHGVPKDLVAGTRGFGNGARLLRLEGEVFTAPRVAWLYMTGKWPVSKVRPLNGDPFDVRWANLRDCAIEVDGELVVPKSAKGIRAYNKLTRERNPDMVKNSNLKTSFGVSLEWYREKLLDQKGVCALCEQPETMVRNGKVKALVVDHCHASGTIRDILCHACNSALGYFKDNPAILRKAADYIERHQKPLGDNIVRLTAKRD